MILRAHEAGGTRSEALYSRCGQYRYRLTRAWGAGPVLVWIMLNPSTATEERNDPTIARCEGRARRGGFGGVEILNLFAFRATRPADLRQVGDPVGPGNGAVVLEGAARAGMILCGWGVHGALQGEGARMRSALLDRGLVLHTLGLTKAGHPRHPLYVGNAVVPQFWPAG